MAEGPIDVEAGSVESLPPILILTLDTTRADHLGLYGYFRDTSPNLDILASQSLVFDDAIAPMATTLPSHLSLMTGLQPLEFAKLPFAVILAWLVFDELPDMFIWIGGAIIFSSTAYITRREAIARKAERPPGSGRAAASL